MRHPSAPLSAAAGLSPAAGECRRRRAPAGGHGRGGGGQAGGGRQGRLGCRAGPEGVQVVRRCRGRLRVSALLYPSVAPARCLSRMRNPLRGGFCASQLRASDHSPRRCCCLRPSLCPSPARTHHPLPRRCVFGSDAAVRARLARGRRRVPAVLWTLELAATRGGTATPPSLQQSLQQRLQQSPQSESQEEQRASGGAGGMRSAP